VLDVGCRPGYASLDLAELVGPSGQILAIGKSERLLDALDRLTPARQGAETSGELSRLTSVAAGTSVLAKPANPVNSARFAVLN
jgi:hypothetical protein